MLFFIGLAVSGLLYWIVIPPKWRRDFMLVASILVLYGLQPQLEVNSLNIVLPTATLIMVVGVWLLVYRPAQTGTLQISGLLKGLGLLVALIGLILLAPQASTLLGLLHDIISQGAQGQVSSVLTIVVLAAVGLVTIPQQKRPLIQYFLSGLSLLVLVLLVRQAMQGLGSLISLVRVLTQNVPHSTPVTLIITLSVLSIIPVLLPETTLTTRKRLAMLWLVVMAGLLIVLKVDAFTAAVNTQLNLENGISAISTAALGWLGISYIVFRLAHVLLDFRSDRLGVQPSLRDFTTYVIFFPSIIGGPITRVEQVTPQLQENLLTLKVDNIVVGVLRLVVGLVKKYVLADQLALIAAGPALFTGSNSILSLWIMLYAFLFQFYLDFSGYSDIAIGLALIFGVRLPENFDRPLLQPNLSLFWNSWHITLSQWFRYYWFNPLTRSLMRSRVRLHPLLIVFLAQTSTMVLIALWHHAAVNWLAWGVWHGLGLFAFKVLGDANRPRFQRWTQKPWRARLFRIVNIFLTFHYFFFSMAFIAFPNLQDGVRFLFALFGVKL